MRILSINFEQFLQAAQKYNTIPVYERFFVDTLTPIQVFQKLHENACYILESNDQASQWANFSFIGLNPHVVLKEEQQQFIASRQNGKIIAKHKRFREALLQTISILKPKPIDIPVPFTGGGVGYISYDGITEFDPTLEDHPHDDMNVPRFHFTFCETIIAFDHHLKEITVITHVFLQNEKEEKYLQQLYENATDKIKQLMNFLLDGQSMSTPVFQMPTQLDDINFDDIKTNFEKDTFLQAVEKVKSHIVNGDISQVVLSQRFEQKISVHGLDIYRVLRVINPSPYLFYLKINDFEVVGSSPEKLVQVSDNHIEIHPIAGTRRRGKTKKEDEQLAQELLRDEKERAEHLMLVELAKNEIARVAKQNSVSVQSLMEIGYFSHVMHIISKVTGTLDVHYSPIDAFISAFPAGTLSGSPKRRAMELIKEIEPTARNLYGGAIGYIGFDGNIDSCITIRTIYIHNKTAYVQAGAGIVADSIPEKEWEETRNKAKALIKAIDIAEQLFNKKGDRHHV